MANNNNSDHHYHQSSSWGMGFFLVFFPTDHQQKKSILSSSPPCSSPFLKRTSSSQLLTRKAQSTISICALLLFLSLLLLTLSTLPPTPPPRRHLSSIKLYATPLSRNNINKTHALQGMGTLYTRGTRPMTDLIICHVSESVYVKEFESFLRLLYRSPLYSRSDILFLFSTSSSSNVLFDSAVYKESELFLQIIGRVYGGADPVGASFDVGPFVKSGKVDKEGEEPMWGRRRARGNFSLGNGTESSPLSYGSVVGFEAEELDPENSLGGFLEYVPMSLRRWACYPMLLGRLRRNFKHAMLVDVKDVLLLGDPLGRVRTRSPESVYLSTTSTGLSKHGRRNSEKTQSHHVKPVYPSIISGRARGVRRLSNAMQTEIARAAMQHKRKSSVTESGILSQLVGNGMLKNVKLVVSSESLPELSSLNSGGALFWSNYTVLRRGNSNLDFYAAFMKHICSFSLDSSVYSDC